MYSILENMNQLAGSGTEIQCHCWCKKINGIYLQSCLYHIYMCNVSDFCSFSNMILFCLEMKMKKRMEKDLTYFRRWKNKTEKVWYVSNGSEPVPCHGAAKRMRRIITTWKKNRSRKLVLRTCVIIVILVDEHTSLCPMPLIELKPDQKLGSIQTWDPFATEIWYIQHYSRLSSVSSQEPLGEARLSVVDEYSSVCSFKVSAEISMLLGDSLNRFKWGCS